MHASLTEPHPVDPRLERLAGELSSAPMPVGVTLRLWNGFKINLGGEKPRGGDQDSAIGRNRRVIGKRDERVAGDFSASNEWHRPAP